MGAPPAPPPNSRVRRSEKEIENSTLAMLQALRTARSVPGKELLRLIDEHSEACQEFAAVLPEAWDRVHKLTSALRIDLRGSGFKELQQGDSSTPGIFSDLLSTLGVTSDVAPALASGQVLNERPAVPAASSSSSQDAMEQAVELGMSLDHIEQGPAKALQAGRRLEAELKEMMKLLDRLQATWPELRTSVEGAFDSGQHLRTKDLGQALKQVLYFRRQFTGAMPSIDALCETLEDATDQVRQREEERLRFKAMSREVLDGQSKALAARTTAVLWLKRAAKTSSSSSSSSRFEIEQAAEALERNLEAAKEIELRLVRGAGVVMRREASHQVVQRTVARLSVLRGKVLSAAQAVSAAREDLAGAGTNGEGDHTEAATAALGDLMTVFDEAAAFVETGGGQSGSG
eukprot:CAMPEP_0197693144 /NCGR_PEP_ID=MMETSP1338-20131121/112083_1 /TAXON_ID=43686 ORGANISM="Pelagodinium beii, Strain RCC1491" /NCGR_SAMPLE_ID=MMETSP1338 /ASSEMBLY_ACC=CAM_ASM_000754 /LENGTH=402 /DNA_ID=CAMNT_0043275859 /DNA_START=12 /DNA_END=1216 /DNA_ORIENTATION=-